MTNIDVDPFLALAILIAFIIFVVIRFYLNLQEHFRDSRDKNACPCCDGHGKNNDPFVIFVGKYVDGVDDTADTDCFACEGGKTFSAFENVVENHRLGNK